jgi:molybdopterin converting factor subunit 1
MTLPNHAVTVLLFGHYRELAGAAAVQLDLAAGSTVEDLVSGLRSMPSLQALPNTVAVAVNRRYAERSETLRPDDEIALIPPVAGG